MPSLKDYRRLFRTFSNRARFEKNRLPKDDARYAILDELDRSADILDEYTTLLMRGDKAPRNSVYDLIDTMRAIVKLDGENGSIFTSEFSPGSEDEREWAEDAARVMNQSAATLGAEGIVATPAMMIQAAREDYVPDGTVIELGDDSEPQIIQFLKHFRG